MNFSTTLITGTIMDWQAALLARGASINSSGGVEFLSSEIGSEVICPLPNKGTVLIQGPDAASFLQGQVTCDINALINTPEQTMLGAHCTHQGRMRFSFRAIALSTDKILLVLPRSMVEIAIESLKKYSVFSKIDDISNVSDSYFWLGLKGSPASQETDRLMGSTDGDNQVVKHELSLLVQLSAEHFELCLFAPPTLEKLWQSLPGWQTVNETYWDYQNVCLGLGAVMPETVESFIPQMLNLQVLASGISFTKGCYTGQEVVARMAYLGKLKKRMYRFSSTEIGIKAGDKVTNSEGKNVGEVVLVAPNYDHGYDQAGQSTLLAVVNNEQAQQPLCIENRQEQKLRLLELPYAIPITGHP